MFIVENYLLAVILCVITMVCWGSWGNTQKLVAKSWRYELFYWDYVIGIVLLSLIFGFTLGSIGDQGRNFVNDVTQVNSNSFWNAFTGGIIFNASNILLSASISLVGMSVAFPVGVGLALVLGVFMNYFGMPQGNPVTLFTGVALITIAIVLNGIATGIISQGTEEKKAKRKGVIIAIFAGFLMSFFYRFVASAMDLNNPKNPIEGMLTPYGAFFIFSLGILASNFMFNTFVMKKPFIGEPVSYKQYFKGNPKLHLVGIFGGIVWGMGTALSYIAAGKAGPAISYALGQGAPMIAALWGVFIWKEFKGAPRSVNNILTLMFILFLTGLSLIVTSGSN